MIIGVSLMGVVWGLDYDYIGLKEGKGGRYSVVSRLTTSANSNRRIMPATNPRLYQVWKGSNRFFLGGHLIFGPDFRSLFLTVCLIVVPVILFCTFISQRIVNEFPHHPGHLIVVLPAVFTTYIFIILFLTSGIDPGNVPRNQHPPEPDDDVSRISTEWAGSQSGAQICLLQKKLLSMGWLSGFNIEKHVCYIAHHDAHTAQYAIIVSKRNYRFFSMFVFSTTVLCLYIFAFCWVNIRNIMEAYHCSLWKAVMKSPVSRILILYTFIASWFVGGTAFHLYLILTNQTTYENFRCHYDGKRNPYNVRCARNFREVFFSKIPTSKNNFRAKVNGDSSSIFSASMTVGQSMSPEIPKTRFDVEMGKRQAVDGEEFEDIQIESVGHLERCGTQSRHTSWDCKNLGC